MKKRILILAAFFLGVVVLWTAGNMITQNDTTKELPQISNPDTIYLDSLTTIASAQDLMLNISRTQESILGSNVFVESSVQMLSYAGLGTENMRASLNETLTIDQHNVTITEYFSDGIGYVTVNDGQFCGEISAEDYQKRFAPAILMDASRYHSIVGYDTGTCYQIEFSKPQNAEQWAFEINTAIENAKGTAFVSYDGQLLGSTYTLSYKRGQTRVRLTYNVDVEILSAEINAPADTAQFRKIEYIDGPRMLERATGYLMQADNVSAKYTDSIYCEAFGDRREQEVSLYTANIDDKWSALVQTKTNLTNDTKIGAESTLLKTETFTDGTYRSITGGSESTENADITSKDMQTYCKNLLIGTVMLPEDISGIRMEETEDRIRLVFSADESFAAKLSANICQMLYQEPDLLHSISQSNTTNSLQGYLEFDRGTFFPTGSGINYDGTYNVEGMPYGVGFYAGQTYDIISKDSQDIIKKAGA